MKPVVRRLWLLVDTEPVRPDSYISATNKELICPVQGKGNPSCTSKKGVKEPIYADSGNGGHLMYAVSLPPDDNGLIQKCLTALAGPFSDEEVTIDQTVYNPARIWKLYGTVARKGDSTTERPHRLSFDLYAPAQIVEVKREQLRELAETVPVPTSTYDTALTGKKGRRAQTLRNQPPGAAYQPYQRQRNSSACRWLSTHQVEVAKHGPWKPKNGTGGYRWVLAVCPMNPNHCDNSAYIVQFGNGGISAGCHHNSCRGWGFPELRQRTRPNHRFYQLLAQLIEASAQLSDGERATACGVLRRLGGLRV